jgi:quercetin dioxygenase-like cupin family protein
MKIKSCAAAAVFVAACMAAPLCAQPAQYHRIVTPDDLQWVDIGSLPPGAKIAVVEGNPNSEGIVTVRIKLPPNYRVPPHYHSTLERSTIMSGTLNIGMGDKFDMQKTSAMPVGTVLLMPPNMTHFAWTKDEVIFQLNVMGPWTVTYVNPADDPRKK